jgi:hypothetical protein
MFANLKNLVPKGRLKLARRFNAGNRWVVSMSPEGTAEDYTLVGIQSSLRDLPVLRRTPGVKTPGYISIVPPGQSIALATA